MADIITFYLRKPTKCCPNFVLCGDSIVAFYLSVKMYTVWLTILQELKLGEVVSGLIVAVYHSLLLLSGGNGKNPQD